MIHRWTSLALLALGCDATIEPLEPELTREQIRLRAAGAQLFQKVGWTYQHRDAAQLAQQLIQRHAEPDRVLSRLPLEPGMVVADIGCGVGFFTFMLAEAVGSSGEVLAVDILPQAVSMVQARGRSAEINPHQNVQASLSTVDDCGIAAASLDLAYMAHLGFYLQPKLLPENQRMLASVLRALEPGGTLAVLEYIPPGQTEIHLVPHLEAAGFALESSEYFRRFQTWLYLFRAPGDDAGEPAPAP